MHCLAPGGIVYRDPKSDIMERVSKLEVYIGFFSLELKESQKSIEKNYRTQRGKRIPIDDGLLNQVYCLA